MKRSKEIGKDFPVQDAAVIDARRRYRESKTAAWIAAGILSASGLALVGTAILGLMRGEFGALHMVWSITALPVGAVITHYFERRNRHVEKDDAGAA